MADSAVQAPAPKPGTYKALETFHIPVPAPSRFSNNYTASILVLEGEIVADPDTLQACLKSELHRSKLRLEQPKSATEAAPAASTAPTPVGEKVREVQPLKSVSSDPPATKN